MRRSPFFAYPNFPHSFYSPPAEAAYHRPRRPFPPSSPPTPPAPTPHSTINIPVFDSAPSRPSSLPSHPHPIPSSPPASPSLPPIGPSSAATAIQSHFRGFYVRRHHPLLHLRSIANAHKQLEELQSELQSPGFPSKVRASEKERLRFSESVMALILRLDAIEGSVAEVRSQRKEATKMAIKLQDALDAIMMQKDEIASLKLTDGPVSDGDMVPDDDVLLCEESEEPLCPDVNMVQRGRHTVSEEGIMDVNKTREEPTSPEDDVADNCRPNFDKYDVTDMFDDNVLTRRLKVEDVGQQREAGELSMSKSGCFESVSRSKSAESLYDAEQDMSCVTAEKGGGDATHATKEKLNGGIDALHLEAYKNHMQNDTVVAKVDQDTSVDGMTGASQGSAKVVSCDGSFTCMDVVQEVKKGRSVDGELCPCPPTAEENCDYPLFSKAAHQNHIYCPSTDLERLTEVNCCSDWKDSPMLHRHGYEKRSDEAPGNPSDDVTSCDEVKAHSSPLSIEGTPSLPDSALLHQLSEDCRQLKSLVGKLLAQNKAQSRVLCALGEKLELLEHQQQLNCQRNRQKIHEKRKLRKASKRSIKCRNYEW